ncbi:aminotransferase class V-fold PLP-dependent enzyme [Pseudohaliea sp.]|uniref:aminotransferase class V-fold PLP-dependent enzyme n=1 Tax=Pseudohaliea sp. TaxID=2740289 RepID=UPI0032EC4F7A
MHSDSEALIERIRAGVIGQGRPIATPFGQRPLVYADYTASGRALDLVEDTLREQVLPWYANTHSETSFTGAQTTALREEARTTIRRALGGGEDDKIIFCGAGATAAINRLIDILGLRLPRDLDQRYDLSARIPAAERPVVFVGPYEHHSNELPWRESIADVVPIPLADDGAIDRDALAGALVRYGDRPLRIGSFSAASNVTGIRSDVPGITQQLKDAGALAFWDYAAAGPYVRIDLNAPGAPIDAVFLSPHKFVGGPGTPGVLAVKRQLLTNSVPAVVGGGTVSFVNPRAHRYLDDPERREEGGTPAIVEAIRAGLVFQLQQAVGTDTIEAIERRRVRQVLDALAEEPNIEVLGGSEAERLAIFSLRFHHGESELHYGFVVALLNDLFGIQARGGCSCAGPYGHALLGLDEGRSTALENQVAEGFGALRPGWVRLNVNYFIDEAELDYLLSALRLVARHGWRLLPSYRLDLRAGLWRHRDGAPQPLVRLTTTDFLKPPAPGAPAMTRDYPALATTAEQILAAGASQAHCRAALADPPLPARTAAECWFALPGEVTGALAITEGKAQTA